MPFGYVRHKLQRWKRNAGISTNQEDKKEIIVEKTVEKIGRKGERKKLGKVQKIEHTQKEENVQIEDDIQIEDNRQIEENMEIEETILIKDLQ